LHTYLFILVYFFFFVSPTSKFYTLSLHDALPILLYHNYFALSIISTNLQHLVLLIGLVSMILTVSPILQSSFSSCATYFLVFNTNLPYIGCFTRLTSETTLDFCILLLVTTPIRSFLKFLFSVFGRIELLSFSFSKLSC